MLHWEINSPSPGRVRGWVNWRGSIYNTNVITAENHHCFVSSVQYPADTGSSPELCPAWAPRSRSPSPLRFVCICPSPSPSRAATWAAAERRYLSCRPLWATQIHHRTTLLFQVQQRPSPSLRPLQLPFQSLSPVSAHTLQLLLPILRNSWRQIQAYHYSVVFTRCMWTATPGTIGHGGLEKRNRPLHSIHRSAPRWGHSYWSGIWFLKLQKK